MAEQLPEVHDEEEQMVQLGIWPGIPAIIPHYPDRTVGSEKEDVGTQRVEGFEQPNLPLVWRTDEA